MSNPKVLGHPRTIRPRSSRRQQLVMRCASILIHQRQQPMCRPRGHCPSFHRWNGTSSQLAPQRSKPSIREAENR